jgi:hypothetical protein
MPYVIVPFVHGRLHPDVVPAVQGSRLPYRLEDLDPTDEGAYGRMVRRLWRLQRTFIICEHDVVPTFDQLRGIAGCGHDWCSFAYDDDLYPPGPMFGLARFSRRLMRDHPHTAEDALVTGRRRDSEAEWWRVDALMARSLLIRRVEWHRHEPAVHHVHVGAPSGPP